MGDSTEKPALSSLAPDGEAGEAAGPPPLVQAAGHGMLRQAEGRPGILAKPTTAAEAAFYRRVTADPSLAALLPFLPRFHGSAEVDPTAAKFTHEVFLDNLCLLVDADVPTATPGATAAAAPASAGATIGAECAGMDYQGWTATSVMDLKLGKARYTPATKPEKVKHTLEKDKGSTSESLGLRVTGLSHSRFVLPPAPPVDTGEQSKISPASDLSSGDEADRRRLAGMVEASAFCAAPAEPAPSELRWVEGKKLGRAVDAAGLRETLERYCTCVEAPDAPPAAASALWDRFTGGRFRARPYRPLVAHYAATARAFLAALDATRFFDDNAFVSSSLLFVHSCAVDTPASPGQLPRLRLRATMKLVDFSQSGSVSAGATYADSLYQFRESLQNLCVILEEILAVSVE